MKILQPFLIALQFLTIIPIRLSTPINNKDMGQSLLYYPLVGLIISGLLVFLIWILGSQPHSIIAILILLSWTILTGGLHLDGLADSADAWLGGIGDKTKTLAIMKDPTCGPIAVATLVLILLTKYTMLVELIAAQHYLAIIFAVTLPRTALPLLFLSTPYVREGGIGALLVQYQPKNASKVMITMVALITILFSGTTLLVTTCILFLLLRYWMQQRLDGTTGDTAGAMVELLETSILIAAVIV